MLSATAVDGAGRLGRDRVVVWRNTRAPQVRLTEPSSGTLVGPDGGGQATVRIAGVVDLTSEPHLGEVSVTTPIRARSDKADIVGEEASLEWLAGLSQRGLVTSSGMSDLARVKPTLLVGMNSESSLQGERAEVGQHCRECLTWHG